MHLQPRLTACKDSHPGCLPSTASRCPGNKLHADTVSTLERISWRWYSFGYWYWYGHWHTDILICTGVLMYWHSDTDTDTDTRRSTVAAPTVLESAAICWEGWEGWNKKWNERRGEDWRWDEMTWDGLGWDEMGWDGMVLVWIGWDRMGWDETR